MKQRKTRKVAVLIGLALAGGVTTAALPIITPAQAAQYYAPTSASVTLNGQPLATSVPPLVENGRTLVPMRDIFEALGATVVWKPADHSIVAQKESKRIWLQIGSKTARVDDRNVWLEEAPQIRNGSTLVPLRFVSEALGAQVAWNNNQRIVSITTTGATKTGGSMVKDMISVPAGAVVPVILDSELSSETAQRGDSFWVTVKSDTVGDSEFPPGTKIKGVVTDVTRETKDQSGAMSVEFRGIKLPNDHRESFDGSLISLDKNDVNQTSSGRIVAKTKTESGTNAKTVLIGAGAGYILGHVILKGNSVLSGVLGALGGYLYGKNQGDKVTPQEALVPKGTELGVRLNAPVNYQDDYGYETQRAPYLR
ncbi:MAG: copper amine oxidase N-terminal domain-containing protein [Abditibacteriaceae bacterium]